MGPGANQEHRTSKGNIIALACGPLHKPRYINPKIEKELVDFKQEIEEKFQQSKLRTFKFPFKKIIPKLPDPLRSTRYNGSNENSIDREAAPPINGGAGRRHINQSSFVSYQNE